METLYEIREKLIEKYYKGERIILPIVRWIFSFIVFWTISGQIGYDIRLKSIIVVLGISLFCAFLPSTVVTLVAAVVSIMHIYSASPVLAGIAAMVLLVLYCLLVGFAPKWSFVVLCIPILYLIEIPYVVPVLLGLIGGPISIFAATAGVIVYYFFGVLKEAATISTGTSIEDILGIYQEVIDGLMGKNEMFLTIIVFAVVILVVYLIRKIPFVYSFEISILVGLIVNMIGFLIGEARIEGEESRIGWVMMGTVISGIVLYIIWFFRLTLDYNRMEQLQFEDEEYYYYVKAVPKVKIVVGNKNVKRIVEESDSEEDMEKNLNN